MSRTNGTRSSWNQQEPDKTEFLAAVRLCRLFCIPSWGHVLGRVSVGRVVF